MVQYQSELEFMLEEISDHVRFGEIQDFYRNPYACSGYFGCHYESICPMYNGEDDFEFVNFERKEVKK